MYNLHTFHHLSPQCHQSKLEIFLKSSVLVFQITLNSVSRDNLCWAPTFTWVGGKKLLLSAQKTAFCILHFIFCLLLFGFHILHFTFIILHHSHEDIYEERRQEKKDASDNDVLFCIVNKGLVTVPNWMKFRENSKRPLPPLPSFSENHIKIFLKSLL